MTLADVVSDVLLGIAAALVVISSIGVLVMRDVYQKLHFVTPGALVAPVLVALAVLVQKGYQEDTAGAFLAVAFLAVAGPVLAHATIRAARTRETGDWRLERLDDAETAESGSDQ